MSHAGRRRPGRLGSRSASALTALTLIAAVAVPAAIAPDGPDGAEIGEAPVVRDTAPAAGSLKRAPSGTLAAPVDQIRAREWHLNALRATKAWRWSKGAGVTVAVLDTGVDRRHPDLVGRVISGPDLTGGTRRPGSRYWGLHGTSMASIIAGHGHGAGLRQGVLGVAPMSRILSIRVTWENDDPLRQNGGQAGRNRDAVAQGIRHAVDKGADVINMSLGGAKPFYNGNETEEEAIRYALSKGVVLIASAGNDGAGPNRRNFPAAYPGVIAVGALDRKLRLWKDSNRRSYVAVCAPGVDIVSADANEGYVVGTGTSPSSAIVAGVAALIRARYPKLTPDEVRQALVQGSAPRGRSTTGASVCAGPLDAARAVTAANRINKQAHGPGSSPKPSASPAPAADSSEDGSGMLLAAILGGGGLLVLIGALLGWRLRRRPGGAPPEPEPVYGGEDDDYLLGSGYKTTPRRDAEREPASAPAMAADEAPSMMAAPVNVPLWQSNEAFPRIPPPPAEPPPPFPAPTAVPEDPLGDRPGGDNGLPAWQAYGATEPDPPEPPTPGGNGTTPMPGGVASFNPGDLRPYVPGEFPGPTFNGNGQTKGSHDLGALNGGSSNGHTLNGNGNGNGGSRGRHGAVNGHDDFGGVNGFESGNGLDGGEAFPNGDADEENLLKGTPLDDSVPLDDDGWERFRKSALEDPAPYGTGNAPGPPPAVPQEGDSGLPPVPPQENPVDELSTGAFPPVPPPGLAGREPPGGLDPLDEDPLGRGFGRPRSSDDDDPRPPWW